jgi:hypothetical protein
MWLVTSYETAKTMRMKSDINCWEPSDPDAVRIQPSTLHIRHVPWSGKKLIVVCTADYKVGPSLQ